MYLINNNKFITLLKWPVKIGAIIYILIGIYWYFSLPLAADDLHRRWIEVGYWFHGYNPIQVRYDGGPILKEFGKMSIVGGYPPWSYFYALFLAPPIIPFNVVKIYFLILNFIAIITLYLLFKWESNNHKVANHCSFLFAAAICCSALPVALRHGQYSILITVAIWGFLYFESRGKSCEAGLLLALACIKPQVAALFFLLPLARRSFMTCFWCLLFGAVATAFASWWCQTWPWTLISDMLDTGLSNNFYMGIGDPLKNIIGSKALLLSSVLIFTFLTFGLLTLWRWASPYQLAAIPAVFSTIWMSHRPSDLMLISFLVVPMFWIVLKNQGTTFIIFALLAGFSHWFPHFDRFYLYWPIPLFYRLLWLLLLTSYLFFISKNREELINNKL